MTEQRSHVSADLLVGHLLRVEPGIEIDGRLVERPFEQRLDLPPAFLRRQHDSLNSRRSQARASAHLRFSVAGDIPSADALSSTLRPTK